MHVVPAGVAMGTLRLCTALRMARRVEWPDLRPQQFGTRAMTQRGERRSAHLPIGKSASGVLCRYSVPEGNVAVFVVGAKRLVKIRKFFTKVGLQSREMPILAQIFTAGASLYRDYALAVITPADPSSDPKSA